MSLRLLKTVDSDDLSFEEIHRYQLVDEAKPFKYAILSHRWRAEEVEYQDCTDVKAAKGKTGWAKLKAFKDTARRDGFEYVWMDTCCIDKTSSTELAEALNSMYEWYRLATKCYAYLDDVLDRPRIIHRDPINESQQATPGHSMQSIAHPRLIELDDVTSTRSHGWQCLGFAGSEWFTRGWTLQELLAPQSLVFYNMHWEVIGPLDQLALMVSAITGIDRALLEGQRSLGSFSIAQRLSWASERRTTRIEDRAYSLFGILDVNMPIVYGEGVRSFYRLQEELLRSSSDLSLFAWRSSNFHHGLTDLLATSPQDFRHCGRMVPMPSKYRGQTHRIIGGRVQLEAFVINDSDERGSKKMQDIHHAVICCFDNDPTKLVTLSLTPFDSSNTTFLVNKGTSRLQVYDIIMAAQGTTPQTFDVWRSEGDAYSSQYRPERGTLLCRCLQDSDSPESSIEIVGGKPVIEWNANLQSLAIPASSEVNDTCQTLVLHIKNAQGPIRLNVHYHFSRRDQRQYPFVDFPTSLRTIPAVFRSHRWFHRCEHPPRYLSKSWKRHGWRFIVATTGTRQLLHVETDVVTVQLVDVQTMTNNVILFMAFSIVRLLVCFMAAFPLWIITLPAGLTRYFLRKSHLSGYDGPGKYDDSADLRLIYGLVGFMAPTVLLSLLRQMHFRSAMTIDTLLQDFQSACHSHLVGFRSGVVVGSNLLSLYFCARYQSLARYHYSSLRSLGHFDRNEYTGLKQEWSGGVAALIHVLFCVVVLLVPLRVIDWIRASAALGLAIPLIKTGIAGMPYTTPWPHESCEDFRIAKPLYASYANSTGQDYSTVCRTFALEGSILWGLVPLKFAECFLALLTARLGQSQLTIFDALIPLFRYIHKLWRDSRREQGSEEESQELTVAATET